MKEFITDEDVEKAIQYLAKSAKPYSEWKARMKYLELHRKSVRAIESLNQTGKSMAENNTKAEASEAYANILNEYAEAVEEFTLLDAYRNAAETKIEAWRTISSSNRRGNI